MAPGMIETYGGMLLNACTWLCYEKIETNMGWTWESNPGPNDQRPAHQPPDHLLAFVIIMDKNYHKGKTNNMLETKTKRARFESSNGEEARGRLLRPTWFSYLRIFIRSKICGFVLKCAIGHINANGDHHHARLSSLNTTMVIDSADFTWNGNA